MVTISFGDYGIVKRAIGHTTLTLMHSVFVTLRQVQPGWGRREQSRFDSPCRQKHCVTSHFDHDALHGVNTFFKVNNCPDVCLQHSWLNLCSLTLGYGHVPKDQLDPKTSSTMYDHASVFMYERSSVIIFEPVQPYVSLPVFLSILSSECVAVCCAGPRRWPRWTPVYPGHICWTRPLSNTTCWTPPLAWC